jgi:hypothetical protein
MRTDTLVDFKPLCVDARRIPTIWTPRLRTAANLTAIALSNSASKIPSGPIAVIANASEPDWSNTRTLKAFTPGIGRPTDRAHFSLPQAATTSSDLLARKMARRRDVVADLRGREIRNHLKRILTHGTGTFDREISSVFCDQRL